VLCGLIDSNMAILKSLRISYLVLSIISYLNPFEHDNALVLVDKLSSFLFLPFISLDVSLDFDEFSV